MQAIPSHLALWSADRVASLANHWIPRGRRCRLLNIGTIAVCAVISGAESWVGVSQRSRIKQDGLTDWLDLPHGLPANDSGSS